VKEKKEFLKAKYGAGHFSKDLKRFRALKD